MFRSEFSRAAARAAATALAGVAGLVFLAAVQAQTVSDAERNVLDQLPPPPIPPRRAPKGIPQYEGLIPESDRPWELPPDLMVELYDRADTYRAYTKRFTCDETARLADYDGSGNATKDKVRHYGYLLLKDAFGEQFREYRQELAKNGTLKKGSVTDEEPFPPAYAWVFLFSRFNEPFFGFRYMGDRFDGFDWIHEIHFRGSLPFTDGQDIRQWEGVILLDAVTLTPLEIRAEPHNQKNRIDALYRRHQQSFSLLGMRAAPKPKGYRAQIQFRERRDQLTFPTELRYDTFVAISPTQIASTKASTRTYENYRFTLIGVDPEIGDVAD